MDKKIPLQVDFEIPNRFAPRWISDQSQFVKDASTKIVSDNREAIAGTAQLETRRENKSESVLFIFFSEHSCNAELSVMHKLRRQSVSSAISHDRVTHRLYYSAVFGQRLFYLSVEMVVQVALLVLCAQHVHDFAVLRSARRALRLAFSVTFKAVLVEGVTAQKVN